MSADTAPVTTPPPAPATPTPPPAEPTPTAPPPQQQPAAPTLDLAEFIAKTKTSLEALKSVRSPSQKLRQVDLIVDDARRHFPQATTAAHTAQMAQIINAALEIQEAMDKPVMPELQSLVDGGYVTPEAVQFYLQAQKHLGDTGGRYVTDLVVAHAERSRDQREVERRIVAENGALKRKFDENENEMQILKKQRVTDEQTIAQLEARLKSIGPAAIATPAAPAPVAATPPPPTQTTTTPLMLDSTSASRKAASDLWSTLAKRPRGQIGAATSGPTKTEATPQEKMAIAGRLGIKA